MIADSLRSLITGLGDPLRDKSSSLVYTDYTLTDDQLQSAYRHSWIAKKIVNIPAQDALRKWRAWQADQKQITAIENEEKRLGVQLKLLELKTLARLWGGAGLFIGTGETDLSQPLNPSEIKKGGIKYLTVVSRRDIVADDIEDDPVSEFYGKPKMYQITSRSMTNSFVDIHPSRVVRQIGELIADPWTHTGPNRGWGDSSLQHVYTSVTNADSTLANVATLVFEACVDVFHIPELMDKMGQKEYREKLLERFTLAAAGKSITKALLMDSEETYERRQASFTGLPDVIQQFMLSVSGGADIPLTRFLGQSPAGLSSTGEGDMLNYQDRITSVQALEIQPELVRLDDCLIGSALGSRPEEIFYNWNPLKQLTEKEKAEIGKLHADTAQVLGSTGIFMSEELREVVGNQMVESGLYPGLGDLLKKNGPDIPDFELERRQTEAAVQSAEQLAKAGPAPKKPNPVTDAKPRTLYLRRDVKNASEIIDWYKAQGVPGVYEPESLHVTVAYSKQPVDWIKVGEPWEAELKIASGGPRLTELFGPAEDVLVLQFASRELAWRHSAVLDAGGSDDFDEYQPHVSISLRASEMADPRAVKPWTGPIVLGPEVFEEIASGDWKTLVKASDEV